MITDALLTELWIVAMCCVANQTDAWPLPADVVEAVVERAQSRPNGVPVLPD